MDWDLFPYFQFWKIQTFRLFVYAALAIMLCAVVISLSVNDTSFRYVAYGAGAAVIAVGTGAMVTAWFERRIIAWLAALIETILALTTVLYWYNEITGQRLL